MKRSFSNTFYYTKQERNGTIVLAVLVLILQFVQISVSRRPLKATTSLASFEIKAHIPYKVMEKVQSQKDTVEPVPIKQRACNPNTADYKALLAAGFTKRSAKSILNYRKKGGYFKTRAALKKIYTLDADTYEKVSPYVLLPKKKAARKAIPKQIKAIALNKGTAEQLMKIRGIGPSFSKRIIKYRLMLGGYTKKEQMKEVYGISDSLYEAIAPLLICDSTHIVPLEMNSAPAEQLRKHPYLNWRQANAIVYFRTEHGAFTTIEGVQSVPELNDEQATYLRIRPYISLD
jgi:competence protein ComEA